MTENRIFERLNPSDTIFNKKDIKKHLADKVLAGEDLTDT